MKKITLILFAFVAFCWQSNAQFTESFETEIPATWTVINLGSTNGWVQGAPVGAAQDGASVAKIIYDSNLYHDDYLITPQIEVAAGVNDRLSFYIRSRSSVFLEFYEVLLSTGTANAEDFTVVLKAESKAPEAWTKVSFNLSDYYGQSVYVAIRATDLNQFELYVDNVVNDAIPSCLTPTDLSASLLNTTDVDITWEAGATETDWTYEYGVSPYTQGGGGTTGTISTTPSLSLTGLTAGETYDIYIQSNCGVEDGDSVFVALQWSQPNLGEICEAAIIVDALPYNTSDNTANYGDNYNGSPGVSGCSTTNTYLNGDDVVYAYTASAEGVINVALSGIGSTYSGMFVYTDCADIGTACVAGHVNSSSTTNYDYDLLVTSGTTYYIVISTWASPQSTTYTLDITEVLCAAPSNLSVTVTSGSEANLVWTELNLTPATEWEYVVQALGAGVPTDGTATTTNPTSISGLTEGSVYEYYVRSDCGGGELSQWAGPFRWDQVLPPANDDCDNAISLTVNPDYTNSIVTAGTSVGATASAQIDDVTGTPNTDVWYSFVATHSGHRVELLNVVNQGGGTSTSIDMGMGVYDGTGGCTGLVFVADSDPNTLNLTGLTPGTTYYVRVYGWSSAIQFNNFNISVGRDPNLSVGDFVNEAAFTYYPNPVKNTLTLNAQNTIEQVAMYNMLGQEVLRATPNAVASNLDLSNLQTGTYFVKVTIANITKTIRVIKQ